MQLDPGVRVAHYRIVAALGAGGMGEVYRATDTRLGRDVALKVLPAEMAGSPDRLERFQREAKALAALDHPGIVTVYSVEEHEGVHFLTMQLVEGEPLDRVIPEDGLPLDRILAIGTALAEALAAAHDKGIVHRDLKPANVMVAKDGRVKVLDFGLVRMTQQEPSGDSELPTHLRTREGVVMGTVPYMSPEQVAGREVDHRTDIFSLGIILYEMTSGRRPFHGNSSAELASAILRDTPCPLGELRGNMPDRLQRAIERCMEKSASHRFSSAHELRDALRSSTDASPAIESAGAPVARPPEAVDSGAARGDEGFWVAVLPFKCVGADADLAALADGLADEIATGLSRFRYLSVVSSGSAARLKGEAGSERTLGARLGARYVLEGSMRMGGSAIRVSAQLVDTRTGAQIWSETFNRDLQASSFFGVQDDLSARIVATVADSYGVLVHSMRSAMQQKDDVHLTPLEWQFQYFAYREQITPSAYAELKSRLERAVERDGRQSDLWACLAQIFVDEYAFGFGTDPAALDRALAAARRAVELDRANQFALVALAQTHFFRQDLAAFGPAAERAMALNPLNTDAVGILGLQIVHTGEFERGAAIVRRAMELNANHAGWMHFAPLWEHFHKGEYEQALERANRVDVPGLFWPFLVMASACGHLGRRAEAEAAVRDLLALDPEFAAHARSNIESWHFASGLLEPLLEGLRKAGLSIPATDGRSGSHGRIGTVTAGTDRAASRTDSGQVRGQEGFWVAVLPFKYTGNDVDLTSFAEGLTESIVTGLSRFSYLRVIARTSIPHPDNQAVDVRSAGKELGARYVMEGSLRQAGTKVRLMVQLVDTESGAHLWSESYDRSFDPAAALDLQDELIARIVSTCADRFGVLARSISDAVRGRESSQLTPYEALMRAFGYHHRLTPADHAEAREALERAVERAPSNADCWAMLSWIYSHEYAHDFNVRPEPLERALAAARRAVDIAPSNQLAQQVLAVVLFFRKETAGCRSAAERAIALNPLDTSNEAIFLLAFTGDWDRGCALTRRAMELNPHHPRWYGAVLGINEYRLANYRAAVDEIVKANAPEIFWMNMMLAAAHAQLGELAAARDAVRNLLAQKSDFAQSAAAFLSKWFDPPLVAHLIEGFRKAGLEVEPTESASTSPQSSKSAAPSSGEARAEEGFWVAVLPFKYGGGNADLTALADGLSEDIVTGLSRFSYLRVIARSSTSRYVNGAADVRAAGRDLGARYVMEGNLRQAGTKLRLAVQLVDAVSGAHIWAENYERTFSPEAVFDLQDDLVPRIVSTVADSSGVLPHSISEMLRTKSADQLSPYEAVLRYFGYLERGSPEEHAKARDALERAVENAPDQSSCWATLAMVYRDEHTHGFNLRPDPLGRALAAAQRAVEAAPSNHLAHHALASALFFRREIVAFRSAAERTLALNPMDSSTAAYLGTLMLHEGDWERGCALAERARQLNPNHPGWYWFAAYWDTYRKQDYRGALAVALKINMPGDFYVPAVIAAAHAQLGEVEAARTALLQLLAMKPDFGATAREEVEKWFGPGELVEHFLEGLRKAGLEVAASDVARSAAADSGVARAEEGFWVAVLPFKYSGASAELAALADGLSEEIVTGLSRFSYLRVIARSSTSRYAQESLDVRSAGKELGARYVMEGSLRQAGTKLRLAVQLVDAVSGAHLWAENYERTFSAESVFEIQDELVPRIVSTVADSNGILVRSMSEAVRSRDPEQLSPYEAVLRSFGYGQRVTPEELAAARFALELAVRKAPAYADAWAMLAWLNLQDYAQGFSLQADSLALGFTAAQRAVDAAPSNPLAWFSLAQALFFQKEFQSFRNAADRAVALNPMDGNSIAFLGELLTYAGDWERGMALAGRAKQLNPNYPGWYWYADFYNAYRQGDYRGALGFALKVNLPGQWFSHAAMAAAFGQLGEADAANKAVRDLLKLRPDFAATVTSVLEKWWEPEYREHMIAGWRKAGLEIAGEQPSNEPSSSRDAAPAQVAIAVLPFSDMSEAKDQEYLCEGMAEEIMNALVQIGGIRVASRTSAFRARKDGSDLSAIARALSVGHILEGSVRTAGNRLRVTAQLTDVASGYQLWSERFDRDAVDIFAVQDEITAGAVEAVKARLGQGERSVRPRPKVGDLEAYRLYLKGRHLRYTKNDHGGALLCYEQATALDPSYAPSWIGLADVSVLASAYGLEPSGDAYAAAKAALQIAAGLQEESAEALYVEAMIAFGERRWNDAERLLVRATHIEPGHVQARCWTGILHCIRGRIEKALEAFEQARGLDPLAPYPYAMTGLCLLQARRPDQASTFLDQALAFDADNILALWVSGAAFTARRLLDPAITRIERAVALSNRGAFFHGTLGWALAEAGRTEDANAVLAALRARPAPATTALPEAWLLAALGDREGAWQVLDRACDEKQLLISFTGLPGFDRLRTDPRFGALLEKMGLPPAPLTEAGR